MKRKLILLNLALVVLVGAAAWQIRVRYSEGRAQEQRIVRQTIRPEPSPPPPELPPPAPAAAAGYGEVAQKTLFSPDRNPDVVVEAPPPKPVPPFPVAYGVMNLGPGPTAILSEKPGAPNRSYRVGDKVGEFTLVSLQRDELILEWDGQQFRKSLNDLKPSATAPAAAPAAPETAAAANQAASTTVSSVQAATAPVDAGPGRDTGDGFRACTPGDSAPAGTVKDGYRKVIYETPFMPVCRWEPVR